MNRLLLIVKNSWWPNWGELPGFLPKSNPSFLKSRSRYQYLKTENKKLVLYWRRRPVFDIGEGLISLCNAWRIWRGPFTISASRGLVEMWEHREQTMDIATITINKYTATSKYDAVYSIQSDRRQIQRLIWRVSYVMVWRCAANPPSALTLRLPQTH